MNDEIMLGTKTKAVARRAGTPWDEDSTLRWAGGPYLFLDWRFVLSGEAGLIGPYWAEPDGTPMKLQLWKDPDRADRPFTARFIPQDIPSGIRLVRKPALKSDPLPAGTAPGTRHPHHPRRRVVPHLILCRRERSFPTDPLPRIHRRTRLTWRSRMHVRLQRSARRGRPGTFGDLSGPVGPGRRAIQDVLPRRHPRHRAGAAGAG